MMLDDSNHVLLQTASYRPIEYIKFFFHRGLYSDLLLSSTNGRLPVIIYFGEKIDFCNIPQKNVLQSYFKKADIQLPLNSKLEKKFLLPQFLYFYFTALPSLGKAMLDETREISVTPEYGRAFPGEAGISGFYKKDGVSLNGITQFTNPIAKYSVGTKESTLAITASDVRGLKITHYFSFCLYSDVLQCSTKLELHKNSVTDSWQLLWLTASTFPISSICDTFQTYYGRWIKEFQKQQNNFHVGLFEKKTVWGRTSHDHFPGVIFSSSSKKNTSSADLLFHLAYSGNHRFLVEQLADGGRQLQFGEYLFPGEVEVGINSSYKTPALLVAAGNGVDKLVEKKLHSFLRNLKSDKKNNLFRPVVYNVWEGIYFNHSMPKLLQLIDKAAKLGAERFVLDDGWFKGRTDDTKALGDWFVCEKKYPEGLTPIIDAVKLKGMEFGLWLEPEMVSKESDLYRTHPNWIIEEENYEQIIGRNQWVLNLSLPKAYNYILKRIQALLLEYDISYIKWDMNRSLTLAAETNGSYLYRKQVLALYALLEEIKKNYPGVAIESCSSGGARIDYGILQYTNRVWLSDSNDAVERVKMQYEALHFLPPEFIGSHVGPRVCHTSGRQLPMEFRAWVSASCHMGYELDLLELTEKEFSTLQKVTKFYKKERDFIISANVVHLNTDDSDFRYVHMYINDEKSRFLLFLYQLNSERWSLSAPIFFNNLLSDSLYEISVVNKDTLLSGNSLKNNFHSDHPLLKNSFFVNGQYLQKNGLNLPLLFPFTALVLLGETSS